MDSAHIINGLLLYLSLVILLTFHEFGHAWMAFKCGDDTAKTMGRCSLNPLVHIDLIGTVILPLIMIFMPGAGRFLVGWAKPVPVNLSNLRNPRMDDILITLAGPWMNLFLAVVLMGLAKAGLIAGSEEIARLCISTATISLLLFFFNLIPIPPLDGSRVMRVVVGMSYETYAQFARFGIIILIIALQIPFVTKGLRVATVGSLRILAEWFAVPLPASLS